jgi:hypothetical protein
VYWLPSACSQAYTSEFLQYSDTDSWNYWADENGTEPLPDLSSLSPGQKYWTTNGEHMAHCAFMLVRLADALNSGKKLDKMTRHFEHSKHCAMMLLDASKESFAWNSIRSWGEVRVGSCW